MEKDFDAWNGRKKRIQKGVFADFVHEREVWWCSLGLNIGFEQDGKNSNFERPILILKKFNRDVILAIPLSTRIKNGPYYVPFSHRSELYIALISQIRLVSTKRLLRKAYNMDRHAFNRIRESVRRMI